jgi:hypothetical protein
MIARDLGRLFGKSSHEMNKVLEDTGLMDRKTKYPTYEARNERYSTEIWRDGFSKQAWVAEKLVPKLVELGHELVIDLPSDLVEPAPLIGPFQCSKRSVLNADGDSVAYCTSPENAKFVSFLLNYAYKKGGIDRMVLKNNGSAKQDQ